MTADASALARTRVARVDRDGRRRSTSTPSSRAADARASTSYRAERQADPLRQRRQRRRRAAHRGRVRGALPERAAAAAGARAEHELVGGHRDRQRLRLRRLVRPPDPRARRRRATSRMGISTSGNSRERAATRSRPRARSGIVDDRLHRRRRRQARGGRRPRGGRSRPTATPRIQEGHLICVHVLCEIVETRCSPADHGLPRPRRRHQRQGARGGVRASRGTSSSCCRARSRGSRCCAPPGCGWWS